MTQNLLAWNVVETLTKPPWVVVCKLCCEPYTQHLEGIYRVWRQWVVSFQGSSFEICWDHATMHPQVIRKEVRLCEAGFDVDLGVRAFVIGPTVQPLPLRWQPNLHYLGSEGVKLIDVSPHVVPQWGWWYLTKGHMVIVSRGVLMSVPLALTWSCALGQIVMDGGPGKAQSLEMYSDALKLVKSQRHLCRSKCLLFWALSIF